MSKPLTVVECTTYLIDVPLIRPHVMSFGATHTVNYVLVKIKTQEGLIGWGEAATFHGPTWSEESSESIQATVDHYFAPRLMGTSLLNYQVALNHVFAPYQGNNFAKAAVEFAVLDIIGKYYDQPVSVLLGGPYRDSIRLSWSLAIGDLEGDLKEAREKYEEGYRIFKFKFGADSWKKDIDRLAAVRQELGDGVSLRVDVNQGWDYNTAKKALKALSDLDVDFLEQPLPRWDTKGMVAITANSPFPIMADESLCGGHAALEMIVRGAADIFAYKLTKLGGLLNAMNTYHMARMAGLGAYIGCMIETSIGTAAYLQFAAAIPELTWGCELWGPAMLKGDVVVRPVQIENGRVYLPQGPGLGIDVDMEKVKLFQR
ncbi:muconate/chloromuconate family cycloisomerase [Desulfobacula sp.]|uniref:muconate/chloromuconate family cycloisomerase n=1 Tax=Desulfobacula sp. TaxID=2593537 RepID=UPI00260C5EA1|nr:muconate/chloromuconate family cycloisomerase [Desulfobacula sp.]